MIKVIKDYDDGQPLLILQQNASMGKSVKETIFDWRMVKQYISKCWELQRFMCYLEKRETILKYGENIILHNNNNENLNKSIFQELFLKSNPPNYVLSDNDVWNQFKISIIYNL